MPYNLLHEPWIPVRYEDGETGWIEPWRVTDPDRPPIALAAPRPDFNGALIQFLIGLVQTCCPPETERDWRRWFKQPPTPDELKAAFSRYEHAFNLDGDDPRFMQDLGDLSQGSEKGLQLLLLDGPAQNATDRNKDHFVKSIPHLELSPAFAAAALLAFQLNVYSTAAGKGYRLQSSLRGSGPVTTLLLERDLWTTIWTNVITRAELEALGSAREHEKGHDIFPWLAVTRSSEEGMITTKEDVNPNQMYWPMPRRVRLQGSQRGACSLSDEAGLTFSMFSELRAGIDYRSPWHHPLSPSSGWNALSVKSGQFTYHDWTTFVVNGDEAAPAVVLQKRWHRARKHIGCSSPRLWVFGYENESGKANIRAYRERVMPIFFVKPEVRADFEEFAGQLVATASELASGLREALADALYPEKGHRPKGASTSSVVQDASTRFWRDTEPAFFDLLAQAQRALEQDAEASLQGLRARWLDDLREQHLLQLFDEITQYGAFRAADPRAVVKARQDLRNTASAYNKKTRQLLGLPKPPKKGGQA